MSGNVNTFSGLSSSGKSGSFFYYSANHEYMVKTISNKEYHLMLKVLPAYYNFVTDNPSSLITLNYGLHKLKFVRKGGRC
jgi:1-phosphatidylinositol-4-phosphate 5-kinase